MVQRRIQFRQEFYFIFLMAALSLLTFYLSFLTSFSELRTHLVFVRYFFINFLFFISLSWLFERLGDHSKLRKIILFISLIYSFLYIVSSVSFITTGQVIRIQTILFIIKVNPPILVWSSLSSLIFLFILFSLLIDKQLTVVRKSNFIFDRKLFLIIVVLLVFILFNIIHSDLNIEEELLINYPKEKRFLLSLDKTTSSSIALPKINNTLPNVVFILLESVSSDRLHSYGYERNVSPNIDFIVENGIKFENVYATATHSDYAQPTYLSSNHVLENNVRNFFNEQKNQNAVWQIFKKEGYKTFYFSSQNDRWAGMNNYFNYSSLDYHWYSETDNLHDYGWGLGKKDYDHQTLEKAIEVLNESLFRCNKTIQNSSNGTLETNNSSIQNCSIDLNQPFFLYLNFQATHEPSPFSFPPEYSYFLPDDSSIIDSEEYRLSAKVNRYDNALRYVDIQVGRLLDYLRETGQFNNTIIIVSSDHGHDLYRRHNSYGHGLSIYEDEIRVPLAFFIPGENPRTVQENVCHIDVLPSLIKMLGFNVPDGIRGRPFESNRKIFFYSQNHMYLIGMIDRDLKVILDLNRKLSEVYNLTSDPLEEKNIIDKGDYTLQIKTLLTWHYCQLNYFSRDPPEDGLEKYCEFFRN